MYVLKLCAVLVLKILNKKFKKKKFGKVNIIELKQISIVQNKNLFINKLIHGLFKKNYIN